MAKVARIVVDASLVAAIGAAPSAKSQPLLAALSAAKGAGLRLIKTPELDEEWQQHVPKNGLFLEWRADMLSRGLVGVRTLATLPALKKRLRQAVPKADHGAVEKDAHLAAAAIETAARVLSLDEKIRGHFARASDRIAELGSIVWANPAHADETVAPWLAAGAPHQSPRTLAKFPPARPRHTRRPAVQT